MPTSGKIDGIQALRTISILMVLVDHALGMASLEKYYGGSASLSLHFGHMGVELFFIISGFIICHVTYGKAGWHDFIDYLRSRFIRIFPLLWLCTGLYFALRILGRGEFSLETLLRSLFLFPVGEIKPNALWSLRHELIFYAVFAFTLFNRRIGMALVVTWCIGCFLFGQADYSDFAGVLSAGANAWFMIGIVMAALYARPVFFAKFRLVLLAIGVTSFMLMSLLQFSGWEPVLLSTLFLLGISVPMDLSGNIFSRLILLLGNASYAIYLTHEAIFSAFLGAATHIVPEYNVLVPLFAVALSLWIGIYFHLYIEQRLIRAVRNLMTRKKSIKVKN